MASGVSAASESAKPPRPRAATTVLPAMTPSSPLPPQQQSQNATMSAIQNPGSPPFEMSDHGITSAAHGPLRHPKPLTPSDLHLALEKEQESMVNRLTRELSLLRQQSASVASTTSSTSTFNDPTDGVYASPSLGSSVHSHTSTRHRSSSSLSSTAPGAHSSQAISVAGIAPSRDKGTASSRNPTEHSWTARSREPSLTSRRPSVGSLFSYSQHQHGDSGCYYGTSPSVYYSRASASNSQPMASPANPMSRYEEVAQHKSELESIKRENEQLRKRVRELEHVLRQHRGAESSPSMSETILISASPDGGG